MERKSRLSWNAPLLVGIVYAAVGSIFSVVGLLLAFWTDDEEARLVGKIFLQIGPAFLVLGLILIAVQLVHKRRNDALMADGRYVWARVEACNVNKLITVNNRHPYIATVCHTDAYGNAKRYKSQPLYIRDPQPLIGLQVQVWIDPSNEENYYVDIDQLLQKASLK